MAEPVLALDAPTDREAFDLLDRLPGVEWVKVGSVLFTQSGPGLVVSLKRRGLRVFLDLKWHDIPNTVKGAMLGARGLGVDMVTVHALGGGSMIRAAKDAAGPGVAVVAVTALTSHSAADLSAILGHPAEPAAEVLRLADLARRAGADGVVSSPQEVAALRSALGSEPLIVAPGIRFGDEASDDQARTAAPRAAVAAGATHLVIGRPIWAAPDPASVWGRLRSECT